MQVMPATARMIASVRTTALSDPQTNIKVGTKYFTKRLAQYNGDVELTLAAYNAGFARVDQWLKRYPTDNKLLFLDFIPFKETREYVSTILRNYYWYVKLYDHELEGSGGEAKKLNAAGPKVLSIITANAGVAASATRR
jgi:soluble lytic murein transglycosylase